VKRLVPAALALALACCGGGGDPYGKVSDELQQVWRVHKGPITSLAFDPGGRLLATASMDLSVKVFEWRSQKLVATLAGPKEPIAPYPLSWSPDGRHLLVGGEEVKVYQTSDWTQVAALKGQHSWIYSIAQADCGGRKVIVTGGGIDHLVQVWDATSCELVKALKGHQGKVYAVAIDSAGSTLASGSWDRTVRFYRTDTWEPAGEVTKVGGSVFAIAFLPQGRSLVTATENGEVTAWDWRNPGGRPVDSERFARHTDAVPALACDREAELLVTGSYDKRVFLYDVRPGRFGMVCQFFSRGGRVYSAEISPDRQSVFAGAEDGSLYIWRIARS
jgi:WD40 repeat protein